MTEFSRQFVNTKIWAEDNIYPEYRVEFFLTKKEVDTIQNWCFETLTGTINVIKITPWYLNLPPRDVYRIVLLLTNEDDVFTMKMTWG